MKKDVTYKEPIFLDLTKNMTIHPLGTAKNLKAIEIGFFIFERGWIETKIIHISDTSKIETLANLDFFNGTYKRFHFNTGQNSYETGLLNIKDFESVEEQDLAEIIVSYTKEVGFFSENFEKFEITVPKKMFYYFKRNY